MSGYMPDGWVCTCGSKTSYHAFACLWPKTLAAIDPEPAASGEDGSTSALRASAPEDFTPAQWEHLIDAADLAWWRSFQALGNAQAWGSYTHRQTFMRAAIAAYESARGDRSKPPQADAVAHLARASHSLAPEGNDARRPRVMALVPYADAKLYARTLSDEGWTALAEGFMQQIEAGETVASLADLDALTTPAGRVAKIDGANAPSLPEGATMGEDAEIAILHGALHDARRAILHAYADPMALGTGTDMDDAVMRCALRAVSEALGETGKARLLMEREWRPLKGEHYRQLKAERDDATAPGGSGSRSGDGEHPLGDRNVDAMCGRCGGPFVTAMSTPPNERICPVCVLPTPEATSDDREAIAELITKNISEPLGPDGWTECLRVADAVLAILRERGRLTT